MEIAEQALKKIESHEKLCEERIRRLDEKLDAQGRDILFNRQSVLALYPFIMVSLGLIEFFK